MISTNTPTLKFNISPLADSISQSTYDIEYEDGGDFSASPLPWYKSTDF